MTVKMAYSQDLVYIAAMIEALPNMIKIQQSIIDTHSVDGDGGDAPFRFTFDTITHRVTLVWDDQYEFWGLEKMETK